MGTILEAVFTVLATNAAVQSAVAVVLVTLIGLLTRRVVWVRHVVAIGIQAYEYAEAEGVLKGLQAYEKFEPFMTKFIEQYWADFGKEPTAKAKAVAVEAMEKAVQGEHLGN